MKKGTVIISRAAGRPPQRSLERLILGQGFHVIEATQPGDFLGALPAADPSLIMVVAGRIDAADGLEAAREIRRYNQKIPIILVSPRRSAEIAIDALRIGITDFLQEPVSPADLADSLSRSLPSGAAEPAPPASPQAPEQSVIAGQIVGRSAAILGIKQLAQKVAATDCTVLITGETGTGKELVADLIHRCSSRASNPYVVVNCAAIPDSLLESEVFGYTKGAFTGASASREGAIHAANRGTLFFDEIGEMSPYAQAKILRTIENKEVCPVGGRKSLPVNVRFIAATNRDLEQAIREKTFRSDLYFRLNVARIHLPPLRERKEDLVPLLEYFRRALNRQLGKEVESFSQEAVAALTEYDWPGNVRELKNLMEATFITAGRCIDSRDFPELFRHQLQENQGLSQNERAQLLAALLSTSWNKTKAAQQLQWSRMTLYRKMAKYQIPPTLEGDNKLSDFGFH